MFEIAGRLVEAEIARAVASLELFVCDAADFHCASWQSCEQRQVTRCNSHNKDLEQFEPPSGVRGCGCRPYQTLIPGGTRGCSPPHAILRRCLRRRDHVFHSCILQVRGTVWQIRLKVVGLRPFGSVPRTTWQPRGKGCQPGPSGDE